MDSDDVQRPPQGPDERYRMRRFTDEEMATMVAVARKGRLGPGKALKVLWDLILRDAEGLGWDEAVAQSAQFSVSDYAIASDQSEQLHAAMVRGRRLDRRELNAISMLWLNESPGVYDAESQDS